MTLSPEMQKLIASVTARSERSELKSEIDSVIDVIGDAHDALYPLTQNASGYLTIKASEAYLAIENAMGILCDMAERLSDTTEAA
ncbi:hypothetical protein [Jiella marina]|uniref:hypothetical protein n=1 Tax=Jiella sp. LLJ827 TaxID=2917712 RepID=UPI002101CAD7|nr:hypothetical protein [Jiella sp. LLJ827]MCQ0989942.1 hypothetical protein [Jiella sp. LLJ827]